MELQTNPQLELAWEYVRNTDKSVFLTGKAGSGKTTFLHQIKNDGTKRLAIVAPTGVAAINAGGMTIHSLFQLPIGLHLPDIQRADSGHKHKFSRRKIRLIQSLDLLVIDEISMVRADLLDAVDAAMRHYRNRARPFGGAQLLMIGDLHQLPPVVKPEDWEMLRRHYDTPYFFSSHALRQTDYIAIELKHIYRQSDPEFIDLLNKVRDNCLDEATLEKLNSRFIADFRPKEGDAHITLTATNAAANNINTNSLRQLAGRPHTFQASIHGEFPSSAYPTEETLTFKVGAQVMFLKNDTQSDECRYFNGKIGRITTIDEEFIWVKCPDDQYGIPVAQAEWQNVKYALNEETKQIEEQVVGLFVQYPLKLAWAITIHKSQGLTFERAIIDAQAAFASGQVYVALSRCKSFEGIVLRSRIGWNSVKTDPLVKQYSAEAERNLPTHSELQQAKREFQSTLLCELFSFDSIMERLGRLYSTYAQHADSLPPGAMQQVQTLAERAESELFVISQKFAPQLAEYFQQDVMPEENELLQARICKASTYFTEKLAAHLQESSQFSTIADNKEVSASLVSQIGSLQLALFVKRACFAACNEGFNTEVYNRAKTNAELEFTRSEAARPAKEMVVPKGVPHPELYQQLLHWRQQTAERRRVPVHDVLPSVSLKELVTHLPTDNSQLRLISGIGKARLKRYGKDLCELIQKFRKEQGIVKPTSKQPKTTDDRSKTAPAKSTTSETKAISFALFQSGKSIAEIAAERSLVPATIEGHLAHFIGLGELDIHAALDRETVDAIQQFLTTHPDAGAAEARSHFGNKYSYGQLKMVMSHVLRNQSR